MHRDSGGNLVHIHHARAPHIVHFGLAARAVRRVRGVGARGAHHRILCEKDIKVVGCAPERLQVARAGGVLQLVQDGCRAVLFANRFGPAALDGLPRDPKVGVAPRSRRLDVARHVHKAAADRGRVVHLRRDVLGCRRVSRLPPAPQAVPVRQGLPVPGEGLVANRGLHAGNRGGLNRVGDAATRHRRVVVPQQRPRAIVRGNVHVIGCRARRLGGQRDKVGG
mmetsp:Transcript_31762/g.80799  ORF Transcript_31762/g.80799 Transcript_31762/m.80799 type:complete len:223 (-) Transcript_31762:6760-7428(-)